MWTRTLRSAGFPSLPGTETWKRPCPCRQAASVGWQSTGLRRPGPESSHPPSKTKVPTLLLAQRVSLSAATPCPLAGSLAPPATPEDWGSPGILPAGSAPKPLALNPASCAHLPMGPGSNLHLFAGKTEQLWPLLTGDFSESESFLNSIQLELEKLDLTQGFWLLPNSGTRELRGRVGQVAALETRGPMLPLPLPLPES